MNKEQCANCVYSNGNATELHCRRFPPIAGESAFMHPVVALDGWCGEWKDKLGPIAKASSGFMQTAVNVNNHAMPISTKATK
jgi:hypothetical protein